MDWFLYDNGPRHERIKQILHKTTEFRYCKLRLYLIKPFRMDIPLTFRAFRSSEEIIAKYWKARK